MKNPINTILERQGFVMMDGALATELECRGANLDHDLWSARVLLDSPELIQAVSEDYLNAGADIIVSASYQASFDGFEKDGVSHDHAATLMKESVHIACRARDSFLARGAQSSTRAWPLVAASVGPYGACLADGSEYHGNYGVGLQQLVDFHRPRLEVLLEAGADLLAFETIPSRKEAEALIKLLPEFPDAQALFSFSCKDDRHVSHGELFSECTELVAGSEQVIAVGINCTPPRFLVSLLQGARANQKPLMVYPNSGEKWIAEEHRWSGHAGDPMSATDWYDAGARIIGGCCRTAPDDIRQMRAELLAHVGNR